MQLTYITPETAEELAGHYEALQFLHAFIPRDVPCDTKKFIENYAGFVTMVYSGKLPIGCFVLYPVQGTSKKSVEIHGVYRQDLKVLLGRPAAKVLMDHIFAEIFKIVFMEARKEKIVAKITPGAKTARVWLRKYGFEKVPNTERACNCSRQKITKAQCKHPVKTIWKLERAKYLGIVRI